MIFLLSFLILALPASTNYKLNDFGFGSGGVANDASTNYRLFGISGQTGASDKFGLIPTQNVAVPPAPTLSNASGFYNKLDITINTAGNSTDTVYAVAISDDDFVTTKYIKSDYFMGTTLVLSDYLTYAQWGGATGTSIYGLRPQTTYKVKAKAMQGKFSESGWGPVSTGQATGSLSISLTIGGVSSGTTIEDAITDVTTTPTGISMGQIDLNQPVEAAQSLTADTNANSGYTILVSQDGNLKNEIDVIFPAVSGTNSAPTAWSTGYGYHTSDHLLGTGNTTRFTNTNTFAQFAITPLEVAYSATPVSNQITYMLYSIQAGSAQSAGNYSQVLTFTMYGVF